MFPQLFGKYMLEGEIAAGGMARVYLATLRGAGGFEKRLVVKQIRPELASDHGFVERFVKEAKTAVELSHPNIVPVYELGVEQGVYYIAMEHCDGATLAELITSGGPLDAEEGAYLGVEVCRALDYAHRRAQVVHRDVTPRNVLIDEEGAVRLIDFGIAAPAQDSDEEARTEVFGSPGHMPPEQLAGNALGPATDVFAVGVLLYEALTGRPAFRRASAKESRAALSEAQPALDAEQPKLAALAPVVARAMRLVVAERTENAEALARPLREYLRTADIGDVARRLGKRVQLARSRAHDQGPWRVGEGLTGLGDGTVVLKSSGKEPAPSSTQTFATNRSFTELTRRIDSDPPPANPTSSPKTRRIPSQPPVGSSSRPPPASMRRASDPAGRSGDRRRFRFGPVSLGLALGLPAATALFTVVTSAERPAAVEAARGPVTPAPLPTLERAAPELESPPAPTPQVASASRAFPRGMPPVASSTAARAQGGTRPTSSGAPPVASAASGASEDAAVRAASLSLTALPGTRVSVAGKEYTTPVEALSLAAGAYRVTFRSATWDGPVSTQVVLLPGKQSRIHADFTNEPPQLIIR